MAMASSPVPRTKLLEYVRFIPMPALPSTLLKFPPSDHTLSTRQFFAVPPTPEHQKAEVTCWIHMLSTTQSLPLKLIAPLLLLPARLEELQSKATPRKVEEVVVMMLFTPWPLPLGVTRYRVLYHDPAPWMVIPEARRPPLIALK